MNIKVFLPENLFRRKQECPLYGEIAIEDHFVSFIIANEHDSKLRLLGYIAPSASGGVKHRLEDVAITFNYDDDSEHIYLTHLNMKPPNGTVVNMFLYDPSKLVLLNCKEEAAKDRDFKDLYFLYQLATKRTRDPFHAPSRFVLFWRLVNLLCASLWKAFPILKHTSLFDHCLEWRRYRQKKRKSVMFSIDKLVGIVVMVTLLFYIDDPGKYLVQISQFIISQLRLLLQSLKGSPVGLKLNGFLNNFLVDCFTYQIHLWDTFLEIVSPVVRNLFIPIAFLGVFGFSFQLAMLSDLISVIALHAHCFYIYATVLYNIDKIGLQVLWKVVLGKVRNPLKNRVESHDYMNRQLYVATILFATLLFIMPTILVYYAVFTVLRMSIYFATAILKLFRRKLLKFPLETLLKWLCGQYYCLDSIELDYQTKITSHIPFCVFNMTFRSSSFRNIFSQEDERSEDKSLPLSDILAEIFHGKIFNLK